MTRCWNVFFWTSDNHSTGRDRNHKIQTKSSKEKFEPIDPDGKIIAILGVEENDTAPCFFFPLRVYIRSLSPHSVQ